MPAPLRDLLLVSLLLGLAPSAAAVTLCAGTGELCVTANAVAPGTTNADTVQASYAVSSTLDPQLTASDAHSCGVVFSQGFSTQAGAGCASERLWLYVFAQEYDAVTPGLCLGSRPYPWCAAPGVSGNCAGVWLPYEGETTHTWHATACTATDMTGVCFTDAAVTLTPTACAGGKAYDAACPNGAPGTQVSAFLDGDEAKLVCVGTGAASVAEDALLP